MVVDDRFISMYNFLHLPLVQDNCCDQGCCNSESVSNSVHAFISDMVAFLFSCRVERFVILCFKYLRLKKMS